MNLNQASLSVVDYFCKVFLPLTRLTEQQILLFGSSYHVPRFDPEDIIDLCAQATEVLKDQGPLLYLDPPIYIVGDLHGDIHDLLRILSRVGDLSKIQILFLGDYVDRGGFSNELVLLLLTILCKYPRNVFLLRGNHEFPKADTQSSLIDELKSLYGHTELFQVYHSVFTWMPIVTIVGNTYFCVHGGISPHFNSIDDIKNIQYPITNYEDNQLVQDLLWSDPCKTIMNYLDSTRGCGVLFGQNAAFQFLEKCHMKLVIRAHQCINEGIEYFKDLVVTVFSSSFYNDEENKGAFLYITPDNRIHNNFLLPLKGLRRTMCSFAQVPHRKASKIRKLSTKKEPKSALSPTGHLLVSPLPKSNARISLTLVPSIVKPRLSSNPAFHIM